MVKRYAIVVKEYKAAYEDDQLIGWNEVNGSPRLLIYTTEETAREFMQALVEGQDCDYKVEFQDIGWVNFFLTEYPFWDKKGRLTLTEKGYPA